MFEPDYVEFTYLSQLNEKQRIKNLIV